jgi:hypothetical protein
MSNYLAIAAVTKALKGLLTNNTPPEVRVVVGRPTGTLGDGEPLPGANIFLYQVTPNTAYTNVSLPSRRADGALVQQPQSALILHYLISVWGKGENDEKELKAQNVLAAVVRKLQVHPVLTRKDIEDALMHDEASTSNLADQVERVRFTMKVLSLEDISRMWSVMLQTPYILSVIYEASVVLIEADEYPHQSLPVLDRNVYVNTFREPVIERIIAKTGAGKPITDGATILIQGRMLQGDRMRVRVDRGIPSGARIATVSDREIEYVLPSGKLHAGLHGLQVSMEILMGKYDPANAIDKRTPHSGCDSRVTSFVVSPMFLQANILAAPHPGDASVTDITITHVVPTIGKSQRILLVLNQLQPVHPPGPEPAPAEGISVPRAASIHGDPDESDTVVFQTKGIDAGTYLVRLQVDGAMSELTLDPGTEQFIGPTIVMP